MNENLNTYTEHEKQLFKCHILDVILSVAFLEMAVLFAILYISEPVSKVPTPHFSSGTVDGVAIYNTFDQRDK